MCHNGNMLFQLILLANVVFFGYASVNGCHPRLLKDCYCGLVYQHTDNSPHFVVNCTNTGFHNTSMLEMLPEETEWLIFTGNHIPVLDSNIFGEDAILNKLSVIDMTNNGIREIKGKAFHKVTNVKRLILNHNDISISENDKENFHHPRVFSNFYNIEELHLTNAFADNTGDQVTQDLHDIFVNSNLTQLYKLHLEQNEIKSFKDSSIFCDLPKLHDLHLGSNVIQSINFNIDCIKMIRYIDLEQNNITKFTQKDLDSFDRATKRNTAGLRLNINGNPFKCDSAVKNLYGWLVQTKVNVDDKFGLECHHARYGKKYIMNLKNFADAKNARMSKAITVLLVVLTIVFISLVAGFIYLRKTSVKNKLSPIFNSITRKVHYTHIESQDV
ncbi:hypothetical protein WA026_005695 [Henosepilachna vigintioctopunctata]|uniref:Uncharacterized protein n=1 Tax=Henosepilachna vigintioctopunctata TaxID=420089 RepID=A0AAW1TX72_9CUCU